MVLFITTIDANGCVNIPAKIIGTMYQELAEEENNVLFGGRLAEYKYYNMDEVIKKSKFCTSDLFFFPIFVTNIE